MTELNRCVPDAWLLGGESEPPTEPSEFDWPERKPPAGCSHMVCLLCKADVKSQAGFRLPLDWDHRELVPTRATQMHESDDWTKVDGIQVEPDYRLYTCRCFYHSLFEMTHTFNPESADEVGNPSRNLPWTCAGHLPLDLPVQLGNRSIADAAALSIAIVDAATDPAKRDVVLGLYFRTHHGALESIVPSALAKAAGGPAPLSDGLKTLFEAQTRLAPLSAFVEELMRYQRGLSNAEPARRAQLVDVLSAAVRQRPAGVVETSTLELLRDEALQGVTTSAQLEMFEVLDREWLVAHAEQLVSKSPAHAGGILARAGRAMLFGNADPDAAMQSLSASARKSGATAETLSAQATAELGVMTMDSGRVLEALKNLR